MKTLLFAGLTMMMLMSTAAEVGQLPVGAYADTEVSTNMPFTVDFGEMSRLAFTLSLDASPSNSVSVSIGTDADEDGNLSTCEAVCTFGYDCGRWFERSGARDDEQVTIAESFGRVEREFLLKRRNIDENWNLVKVTRRGGSAISEMTWIEGRKPGVSLMLR